MEPRADVDDAHHRRRPGRGVGCDSRLRSRGAATSSSINAGHRAATFDGAATIGDGVVVAEDSMELDLESGAPLALPRGERALSTTARSDAPLVVEL